MADTLCGPSNPLQSFQKHSQVDRTLQQDRLVGPRASSSQSFRTPDPRAGSLDAEFAAFEAGRQSHFQFEQPLPGHAFPSFQPQPSASSWAADFQRLQLSSQEIPLQQFGMETPLVRANNGGWQNEFMRQRQNPAIQTAHGNQAVQAGQTYGVNWNQQYAPTFQSQFQPLYYGRSMASGMVEEDTQVRQGTEQSLNDESFAKQFDELARMNPASEQKTHPFLQTGLHEDQAYMNDQFPTTINYDKSQEDMRIGSDAIKYRPQGMPIEMTPEQQARDASDLARTAGQLLHSVSHETSKKFQESQFMALMRKIRDREVEVRDDDFKPTAASQQFTPFNEQQQHVTPPVSDLRPHDPNSFDFPDMNRVYEPDADNFNNLGPEEYTFDDDQFGHRYPPQSQMQALHPGGRYYPEQSSPPPTHSLPQVQMSGGLSAEQFKQSNKSTSQSAGYQMPSVEDASV